MSNKYSVYPNNYDGSTQLPLAIDNVTPINAEVVNRLIDCVQAIEAELGIKPSGTYATVRARLDDLIASVGGGGGGANVIAAMTTTFPDGGAVLQTKTSTVAFPVNAIVEKVRLITSAGINSGTAGQAEVYIGTLSSYNSFFSTPNFAGGGLTGLASPGDVLDVYLNTSIAQGDILTISWINNGANISGDMTVYLTYFTPQG